MIGIIFQGWSKKVYHYKTAGIDFKVDDQAVIKDTNGMLQVVTVTHVDVTKEKSNIKYKEVFGKVLAA